MKKSPWQGILMKNVIRILKGWYWLIEECTLKKKKKKKGVTIIRQLEWNIPS